ncbi:MAG: LysM peptidoglycan-binding domain-containing protein [Ilumatobacteraceae bacterium]
MVPVVRAQRNKPDLEAHRPRNPLMTRVCMMVGVMLLCVPIALTLRDDKNQARAAEVQGVDTVFVGKMPPAPTDATLAPDTAAPTTIVITTTALPTTAAPAATPAPTEAALVTAAPTDPPTTAKVVKKKVVVAKTTTTPAPPPPVAATQSVAKVACTQSYTVASGDAWSTIAARAKVSMTSLLAANNATIQTMLLAGKKICLPAGAVTPAPPTTKAPATKPTTATTQPATTQPKATVPATTQPKTPPATTVPATTQPPAPPNTYSKAEVAQIIRDVWPDDLEDQAITIATRESNLIPTVHNYCCYGLFQIYFTANKSFLASIGITNAAQLYDPRVNATAALALYNHSGWAPWSLPTPTTVVLS